MKNKLNEAFDHIDDKFIAETENPPKRSRTLRLALVAAALVAVIVAVSVITAMNVRKENDSLQLADAANGKTEDMPDGDTEEDEGVFDTEEDSIIATDTEATIGNPYGGEEDGVLDPPGELQKTETEGFHTIFNVDKGNYSGAKYSYVADLSAAPVNCDHKGDLWTEYRGKGKELSGFYDNIYKLLLDGEKNGVISPINIYTGLCLLAECTAGQSRAEILKALGADSIEELRDNSKLLWQYNNVNDELGVTTQANSIWLADSLPIKQSCADILNNEHYASAFSGSFSDENYVNSFKQWLSDQTGGLLDKSISDINVISDITYAILSSTIYYKSRWSDEFKETEYGKFDGKTCVYNKKTQLGYIYKGSGFTAYCEPLSDGNKMWFFLPDDGVTVSDVLSKGLISYINGAKEEKFCTVTFRMPDFDVSYDSAINGALGKLGINDCRTKEGDFSPLSDNNELYLGEVRHAVRIKVDKQGVEGAALMVEYLCYSPETPPPAYDFTLDRPFVFAVENNGTPLFVGCVNEL